MSQFIVTDPTLLGISVKSLHRFLDAIEESGLPFHSCMILRHGKVALEAYWKPNRADETHRLYSATKSFVSVAIGLLVDKKMLSLDDKIVSFFPDLVSKATHPFVREATVRDLLRMATPFKKPTYGDPDESGKDWLASYFRTKADRPASTEWSYDSCGTYVLGAIVRRLTGKQFYEFLREEILDELEISKDSRCLLGPDGEAWAGSAILLSTRDFATFSQFLLQGGVWNGKRLVSEEYLREATTKQIDNDPERTGESWRCGYGYQFWILRDNAFCMLGAGGQISVCFPKKDLVFVSTADIQGRSDGKSLIFDMLWREIIETLDTDASDADAHESLLARCEALTLPIVAGAATSPIAAQVCGKTYRVEPNAMGITEMSLTLDGNEGALTYKNARGEKTIRFGLCQNLTTTFPETHFHGDRLGEPSGREFRTVNSGAWISHTTFSLRCNIIDDYVGNLTVTLAFEGDSLDLSMQKNAQFFLKDYHGVARGTRTIAK